MARSRASVLLAAGLVLGCGSDPELAPSSDPSERLPGGDTTNTLLFGANAFTLPAENITDEHEASFFTGNSFFNQSWVQAPSSTQARDGLGPLFNARSCAACHFKDGRGRPPLEPDEEFLGLLLRLAVPGSDANGAPLPEPNYGGQLQPFAIDGVVAEGRPRVVYAQVEGSYADGEPYTLLRPSYVIDELAHGPLAPAVLVSPRVAPAVIGLGLLQAIPEARLEELADPDDGDHDGISGRIQRVWDVGRGRVAVGRFGWKAEQPSVEQQAAGAFLGDIGITSSLFPQQDCSPAESDCQAAIAGGEPEIADHLLDKVDLYSRLLAVPMRDRWNDAEVRGGQRLFGEAGCAGCHVPRHVTAPDADLVEVRHQVIWPYTDLLLHDMGPELSDYRPVFAAEGSEWRTPPLWGLGRYGAVNGHDRLLHDGRARGVAEAILWHGGEAEASREHFRSLAAADRALLVQFVESL